MLLELLLKCIRLEEDDYTASNLVDLLIDGFLDELGHPGKLLRVRPGVIPEVVSINTEGFEVLITDDVSARKPGSRVLLGQKREICGRL